MLDKQALRGIYPPILTPLTPEEEVDHPSLARLIDFLITEGVHGIWLLGTTGEFASLNEKERAAVAETAMEAVRGRVPVIVNVGDCSTKAAIAHARGAQRAGADALALLPPYYYPNSQDELLDHFRKVRDAVDLPLFAYSIPQTVKVKFTVDTVLKLAQEGVIVGIKDSQNDLDWFRQLMVGARKSGLDLKGFLGTRYLIDAGLVTGAVGAIPSIANAVPAFCVRCYEAAARGDWAGAALYQEKVMAATQLHTVSKVAGANAGVLAGMKVALRLMGVIASSTVGSPLHNLTAEEEAKIAKILESLGVSQAV